MFLTHGYTSGNKKNYSRIYESFNEFITCIFFYNKTMFYILHLWNYIQ